MVSDVIKERRQKLRETLEWLRYVPHLPPGFSFDMRSWCSKNETCGTQHCIMGWYVARNPDMGLGFKTKGDDVAEGISWIRETEREDWSRDEEESALFAKYFGVSEPLANRLFFPRGNIGLSVVDRIGYAKAALRDLDAYEAIEVWPADNTLTYDMAEMLLADTELNLSASCGRVYVSYESKIPVESLSKLIKLMKLLRIESIVSGDGHDE